MVRQIKKNIKKSEMARFQDLYETTIGSLVTTLGILSQKTEEENYAEFQSLKKRNKKLNFDNICNLVKFVNNEYSKLSDDLLEKIVYVTDLRGLRSPMFSLQYNERVLPLTREGRFTGILNFLEDDDTDIISLFDAFEETDAQ